MEWHQANRIKASMAYIEKLLNELEEHLDGKKSVYHKVHNDLSREEAEKTRILLKELLEEVKKAKQEFRLNEDEFNLSHIMEVDSNFIWETVEDLWSKKLEKSSGKIDSIEEKERLDKILSSIYDKSVELKRIAVTVKSRKKRVSHEKRKTK